MVDPGDSFDATHHRKYFHDYVQGDIGHICLGDDKPLDIIGKGKVLIKLENGNQYLVKEVNHVPDLRKNLISPRKLGSEGCISTFTKKNGRSLKEHQ